MHGALGMVQKAMNTVTLKRNKKKENVALKMYIITRYSTDCHMWLVVKQSYFVIASCT